MDWRSSGVKILSGANRSTAAAAVRGVLRIGETGYSAMMRLRNHGYARGWFKVHDAGRPVVSVGNLTAGGTGKTPVVYWLAQQLRHLGYQPAILLRGYKQNSRGQSDEAQWLTERLAEDAALPPVGVYANPDRLAGARQALAERPGTHLFILDDGFQHRRLRRQFDWVLVNAAQPWGYGHVHPRGLLREPLEGLARADAVLLTHCGQAIPRLLDIVRQTIAQYAPAARIDQARHEHVGYMPLGQNALRPMSSLPHGRCWAFCGIGDPESFRDQLLATPIDLAGFTAFGDHHAYSAIEIAMLCAEAREVGATYLLTTEKDGVKLQGLAAPLPIGVVRLEARIERSEAIVQQIIEKLHLPPR